MKVLQLIDSLDSGGAERMAVNYANMLSIDKMSFICATRSEGLLKETIHSDVGYLFLNKKHVLDLKAIMRLNSYIKENEITIIHAHSTSFFLATIISVLNSNVKLIWHDHYGNSEFLIHRKFKVLKLCSIKFKTIISVNKTLKEWAESHLKCKKVFFLNNFVFEDKDEISKTLLNGENGKRIVSLANLRPQKDHFMLLNAFKEVNKSNKEWTLHLIGKDKNDDYSSKIKKRIVELKLNNHVFIYGGRSDIYNILSQSEIGVLSSKSEGLPLSLLEYGLAKLAVVATNVGDCNKVISGNTEGVLVNSCDIKTYSRALLYYIDNASLRVNAGNLLYNNVISNFSAKKTIQQLVSIYSNR